MFFCADPEIGQFIVGVEVADDSAGLHREGPHLLRILLGKLLAHGGKTPKNCTSLVADHITLKDKQWKQSYYEWDLLNSVEKMLEKSLELTPPRQVEP